LVKFDISVGTTPGATALTRMPRSPSAAASVAALPGCLRVGITLVILRTLKTAISIPDEIFEQAERLAKTRGWSRSELYAKAVSAFVQSERFSGVREKLDAVYADAADDSTVEPLIADAQARSMAKENW
jgi:predicted transcriptional regulator